MPTPYQYLLPINIAIAISCTCVLFLFLPRLISAILRRNIARRAVPNIAILVSAIFGMFVFVANTNVDSFTSELNPPHGVEYGMWDENPSMELFGGTALFYGQESLSIGSNDWPAQQREISIERFLRYLLPPPLRNTCYSLSTTGCLWADIDNENYAFRAQWREYIIRLLIGFLCGVAIYISILLKHKRIVAITRAEDAG